MARFSTVSLTSVIVSFASSKVAIHGTSNVAVPEVILAVVDSVGCGTSSASSPSTSAGTSSTSCSTTAESLSLMARFSAASLTSAIVSFASFTVVVKGTSNVAVSEVILTVVDSVGCGTICICSSSSTLELSTTTSRDAVVVTMSLFVSSKAVVLGNKMSSSSCSNKEF